ncbi:uncharacterized protein LOC142224576 [Haematobia irritans]|uniref:uncharacterized protein LOC142224576 n=1 Tax=Haematobia irritans TaxID=7368 RepID=UPI003F4FFC4D
MSAIGLSATNSTIPTYFAGTSSTLLDLFFVTDLSDVVLYDQLSASCFSNHDLIFMSYKFAIIKDSYRNFNNIDLDLLLLSCATVNWKQIYNIVSVENQVDFLQDHICALQDVFVPMVTKRILHKDKPWFSHEIHDAIERRNMAFRRWKRFRTSNLRNEYRSCRDLVNRMIRSAKTRPEIVFCH